MNWPTVVEGVKRIRPSIGAILENMATPEDPKLKSRVVALSFPAGSIALRYFTAKRNLADLEDALRVVTGRKVQVEIRRGE
jgi:hypothetical protein